MLIGIIVSLLMLTGCSTGIFTGETGGYEKYQTEFYDLFDTRTSISGYAQSEEEFENYVRVMYDRLTDLHQKYDIYHEYTGIVNLYTLNQNAATAPVVVDQDILSMLLKAREVYEQTQGMVNIAMGPVLSIWHTYRTDGLEDEGNAKLPPGDLLTEAAKNTDIRDLLINERDRTVYFQKPGMSLDVGAIAKGYAAYLAVEDAKAAGMQSAVVNLGGNVVTIGRPLDNTRDKWGVGIQNPALDIDGAANIMDVVYVNDAAVVSSGAYQRFYTVDGKRYNHIIDPSTLMPADRYSAITIVHPDSATADALSTALFILPMDAGRDIVEKAGAEALWILHDGSVEATAGYKAISKTGGYQNGVS